MLFVETIAAMIYYCVTVVYMNGYVCLKTATSVYNKCRFQDIMSFLSSLLLTFPKIYVILEYTKQAIRKYKGI